MSDIRKAIMARLGWLANKVEMAKPTPAQAKQIREAARPPAEGIRKMQENLAYLNRELKQAIKSKDQGRVSLLEGDITDLEWAIDGAKSGNRQQVLKAFRETGSRDNCPSDVWYWAGGEVGRWSRSGAKKKMAANISRGIDPNKGGQWITGTWDGGIWGALVFSEPSEFGIPEFPHISKLYMNTRDKPGVGHFLVHYERGWDIRPSTPELKKGYQEIARLATTAAKKAAAAGWYSRPGAKVTAGRAEDLYRKLSSGTITYANMKEWDRLISEALRLPDFTPAGGDMSLHEIAEDLGTDILALKSRASRPGAKAKFAFDGVVVKEDAQFIYYYPEEDDRMTFADADGKGAYTVKSNKTGKPISTKTYRTWNEATDASNAINAKVPPLKKRKASMSGSGSKAKFASKRTTAGQLRKDLKRQGFTNPSDWEWHGIAASDADSTPYWLHEDGSMEKITSSRPGAKSTHAAPDETEREDVKAGLKIMSAADPKVSDKIRTLIKEGKPQDQAVAIALDMKRRGEL